MNNSIKIGDVFGRLTVIKKADDYILPSSGRHINRWICECECGKKTIVFANHLTSGHTLSCGCLFKEKYKTANTIHNLSYTRIYYEYRNMKQRCYNPNNKRYPRYGGRGITICNEWLDKDNGFINFYNWAINNGYRDNLSIDRINVNGNYEPNNCRWIPKEYQAYNRENNIKINFNNDKYTISQIANILGIDFSKLQRKLKKNNWDLSSLFTYITDQYGNTRPYILDKYNNPIPINIIYFIDEYGFPINMNEYK